MRKIINMTTFAICVVSGICSTLHAEERTRIFVHALEPSSNLEGAALLSSRFDEALYKRLSRSTVVSPVSKRTGADDGAKKTVQASRLLKALVSAKKLHQAKKFSDVVALLKPTLLAFEKEVGPNDSFADYLEALAYLGASYVSLGYGGDAKDAFRHLATLTGKARWSDLSNLADEFDKGVSKKYDKTAKKWLKKKTGNVKGTGGAEVTFASVDQREPMTLEAVNRLALPRGRHRVTCYTSNRVPVNHVWLKVKSGKTTGFDCTSESAVSKNDAPKVDWGGFVRNLKFSPNDNQTVDEGRSIAKKLDVEFLVIPFLRKSGEKFEIVGTLFSRKAGMTVRLGVFSFRRDIASALEQVEILALSIEGSVQSFPYQNALIAGFLSKPSSRLTQGMLGPSQGPVSKKRTKWHKTWWFWTTTVVVVGGLSTAGYLLLDGESDSGEFDLEVTW
ncbi:MAG: hypothetical protein ACPGQS_10225 [Bradymonadia bacterium]